MFKKWFIFLISIPFICFSKPSDPIILNGDTILTTQQLENYKINISNDSLLLSPYLENDINFSEVYKLNDNTWYVLISENFIRQYRRNYTLSSWYLIKVSPKKTINKIYFSPFTKFSINEFSDPFCRKMIVIPESKEIYVVAYDRYVAGDRWIDGSGWVSYNQIYNKIIKFDTDLNITIEFSNKNIWIKEIWGYYNISITPNSISAYLSDTWPVKYIGQNYGILKINRTDCSFTWDTLKAKTDVKNFIINKNICKSKSKYIFNLQGRKIDISTKRIKSWNTILNR